MNQSSPEQPVSRREFVSRVAKAGLSVAAASAIGYWLHDPRGPRPGGDAPAPVILPDFSVQSPGKKISIVTGTDRVRTVNRALTALGGIERFIKKGDRVLLKVNAAFASPPALGATTHPDLVAAVTRLCFQAGAAQVIVADNPINDPQSCFALTGIAAAAQSAGATVVLPQSASFQPTTVPGAMLIKNWPLFTAPFRGVTKLIGLAPVKNHYRSGASLAMKNWYGLLGGRRNMFHQNINTIIKELALLVKPTLVILDGTTAMMTNGPTGGSLDDLKPTNTLIASADQVAADACGAALLGKSVAELPWLGQAAAAGLGTVDFESLNPVRDHVG